MRQTPEQVEVRPTAFKAAGPQPDVIREQERDATLTLVGEDEQRFCIRTLHDCSAGRAARVDDAKPFAPVRRLAFGAFKAAGDRMAPAKLGEFRPVCLICDVAAGLGWQDRIEWRAPDAG